MGLTAHVWRFVGNLQAPQGTECRDAPQLQHALSIIGLDMDLGEGQVNGRSFSGTHAAGRSAHASGDSWVSRGCIARRCPGASWYAHDDQKQAWHRSDSGKSNGERGKIPVGHGQGDDGRRRESTKGTKAARTGRVAWWLTR